MRLATRRPTSKSRYVGIAIINWLKTSGGVRIAEIMRMMTKIIARSDLSLSTLANPVLTAMKIAVGH